VSYRDRNHLRESLHHLEILQQHLTVGPLTKLVVLDAVSLRLSCAIDALNSLDPDQRDPLFGETWHEMWATRNRITHAYDLIDYEIIAATIEQDVPPLIETLRAALDTESTDI
jgi:uncharacterized protein with HEPN domain